MTPTYRLASKTQAESLLEYAIACRRLDGRRLRRYKYGMSKRKAMTVAEMGRLGGHARAAKLRKLAPGRLAEIASAGGRAFAAKCAEKRRLSEGSGRVQPA